MVSVSLNLGEEDNKLWGQYSLQACSPQIEVDNITCICPD